MTGIEASARAIVAVVILCGILILLLQVYFGICYAFHRIRGKKITFNAWLKATYPWAVEDD